MQNVAKILKVTILTGFLGSGKTTLINHLLKNTKKKFAIIENEFGSVNIDSSLIKANLNDIDITELTNGCVCCSVRGELTSALLEILERIDQGLLNVEHLLLETTGLADPAPIIQTFFVDEVLRERIILDAVITLVDAKHILQQIQEHKVVLSQLAFADKILLTKSDLVDEEELEKVLNRINKINKKAEIFEVKNGELAEDIWIDIDAFSMDDKLQVNQGFFQANSKFSLFKKNDLSFEDNISSLVFEAGELDIDKIGAFMEELIEKYGNDMLRYKGILAIKNEEQKLIIQGVHKVVAFDYGEAFEGEKKSLFIVIGRALPEEEFKKAFQESQV